MAVGTEDGRILVFQNNELISEYIVSARQKRITALLACSKGFFCSVDESLICSYEKNDDKDYIKTKEIVVPEEQTISRLLLSPSEDVLVASTQSRQLFSIRLSSLEAVLKIS